MDGEIVLDSERSEIPLTGATHEGYKRRQDTLPHKRDRPNAVDDIMSRIVSGDTEHVRKIGLLQARISKQPNPNPN